MSTFGSQNTNCGNVRDSYNTLNNCNIWATDETRQILEWISPLAPRQRHRDVRKSQMEGLGDWLLQTDEFVNWNTGEDGVVSPVLFGYGDPGAGKTHLSSLVIETLLRQSEGKQIAVACLYCDFDAHKEQSNVSILGAILKQVVSGLEYVPGDIEAAFQKSKKQLDGRELESGEMLELLTSSLRTLGRSYICIDALDELPREHRPELFKSLAQVVRQSPRTRLFLTGRQHIWEEVRRHFTRSVNIRIKPTEEDIKKYLIMRLSDDTQPEAMNQHLREEILHTVLERISGIFLLVSLSLNAILAQSTIHRRRETLKQMTSGQGTGGAYAATLDRIRSQDGDKGKLGMEVLMWISRSERPLRAEELRHALAIEKDSTKLDPENVPAIGTLLSCCLGLVAMDGEGSRVRLIHLTLQEYLSGHPNLFTSAHSEMAEVCLTYLNFLNIKDLPPTLLAPPPQEPFLEYASHHWGDHARKGSTEHTKSLALQFLDRYDQHVCAKLLVVRQRVWPFYRSYERECSTSGFTGLHAIACFGVVEIAAAMINLGGWEVNGKDFLQFTPLMWAVRTNNEGVCKLLLELEGVDPNITDGRGRTPLLMASVDGNEGIVKLLLERKEINLNSSDDAGQTPLWGAAKSGCKGILQRLLEREEVNADSSDKYGRMPLSEAAEHGHEEIVKLLLQRKEVNPGASDKYGRTPLSVAAKNGHEGVVRLLLGCKEVNLDSSDNGGRTPLSGAAWNGHDGVVKLLLELKEVNPDSSDHGGRTPLSVAAGNGHEGTAKLLLESKEVNPNSADHDGRTPLSWAARNGHEATLKLLLGYGEVDPESPDKRGRSPLLRAAENRHEGVVKLLFGRKEVNPDSPDNNGRTPLSMAAENGHGGIVKLLLSEASRNSPDQYSRTPPSAAAKEMRDGIPAVKPFFGLREVNPDSSDHGGQTPLWWAASGGHGVVVRLLLELKEVNPDSPDACGRTPLSRAARKGHEGVLKLLLELKEVKPDSSDKYGRTPLSVAAEYGREGAVKQLLGCKEVNPDSPDNSGRTPLSVAAGNGHEGAVKLLLSEFNCNSSNQYCQAPLSVTAGSGREAAPVVEPLFELMRVNPASSDHGGQTPLLWAARNGHEAIVKLLLKLEGVNPDSSDNNGRTPLSVAAEHGHEGTVNLLLERRNANSHSPEPHDQAPLSVTAENGREAAPAAELPLELKKVNPDSPDHRGQTPLSWACRNGHEVVVRSLLELKEVNPDLPDKYSRTPLLRAAAYGKEGIVKLLLEHTGSGVNPDPSDSYGQTPLSEAAYYGHEGTVKLLLQHEAVNPDSSHNGGRTVLSRAAWNGHEGIIKLLLERADVNPDSVDNNGRTPLLGAAWGGHEGVVRLLLERKEVNPGSSDNRGRTPLSGAVKNRHGSIAKILQERLSLNQKNSEGESEKAHSPVTPDKTPTRQITPDPSDDNNLEPQSHACEGDSVAQKYRDIAMNTMGANRNYSRLAILAILLFLCSAPPLVLKGCLILGVLAFLFGLF